MITKLLNLFQYHTFRAGAACLTAFVLSLIFGDWVIRKLISLKVGQPIRTAEEVNKLFELHGKKAGTPTMGGVLIIGTFAARGAAVVRLEQRFRLDLPGHHGAARRARLLG